MPDHIQRRGIQYKLSVAYPHSLLVGSSKPLVLGHLGPLPRCFQSWVLLPWFWPLKHSQLSSRHQQSSWSRCLPLPQHQISSARKVNIHQVIHCALQTTNWGITEEIDAKVFSALHNLEELRHSSRVTGSLHEEFLGLPFGPPYSPLKGPSALQIGSPVIIWVTRRLSPPGSLCQLP